MKLKTRIGKGRRRRCKFRKYLLKIRKSYFLLEKKDHERDIKKKIEVVKLRNAPHIFADENIYDYPDAKPRKESSICIDSKFIIYPIHYLGGYLPLFEIIISNIDKLTNRIKVRFEDTDDYINCYVDRERKVFYGHKEGDLPWLMNNNGIYVGQYLIIEHVIGETFVLRRELIDEPIKAYLKIFEIDENQAWSSKLEKRTLHYNTDPYIYAYGNSVIDNYKARIKEADKVKYGILTLMYNKMSDLSKSNDEIHWSILYHEIFKKRVCSHNTVLNELYKSSNKCFENKGDGYWSFDSSPGARPMRRSKINCLTNIEKYDYDRSLEAKYLISGPAPFGRIINYLIRIHNNDYDTIKRNVINSNNIDEWCVNMMAGLNLITKSEDTYVLNNRLVDFMKYISKRYPFRIERNRKELFILANDLKNNAPSFYNCVMDIIKKSAAINNICVFMLKNSIKIIKKRGFYNKFGKDFGINKAHFNRLPSLLRLAELCGILKEKRGQIIPIYAELVSEK